MKMITITARDALEPRAFSPVMQSALRELGELTVITRADLWSEDDICAKIREHDVLLTAWGSLPTPAAIAEDRGNLQYICNITGSLRPYVAECHVRAGIPVTNWGDTPAQTVAEGAMALLLAVCKNFKAQTAQVSAGGWGHFGLPLTTLRKLRIGIYGMGVIGCKFVEMLAPFKPIVKAFDPFVANMPEGVTRVDTLEALFDDIDCFVVHAGLTTETEGSITAELLAKLPDDAIVINTARGGLFDQPALMRELENGRLRAGIDVLTGTDSLPLNHPGRNWPNVVWTCHVVSGATWPEYIDELADFQEVAIDNLQRYQKGEPLRFLMDLTRFLRST